MSIDIKIPDIDLQKFQNEALSEVMKVVGLHGNVINNLTNALTTEKEERKCEAYHYEQKINELTEVIHRKETKNE